MKRIHKILIAVGVVLALLLVGAAITIRLQSGPGGGSDNSKTPLGGLFTRVIAVSDLKQQMGELRSFHTALMLFAGAHDGDLPKTVAELRSCLPKQLQYLDDDHWELPTAGKLTALMNANDANTTIFLQQKDVAPGKAKIILYADGHIEYRK